MQVSVILLICETKILYHFDFPCHVVFPKWPNVESVMFGLKFPETTMKFDIPIENIYLFILFILDFVFYSENRISLKQ